MNHFFSYYCDSASDDWTVFEQIDDNIIKICTTKTSAYASFIAGSLNHCKDFSPSVIDYAQPVPEQNEEANEVP